MIQSRKREHVETVLKEGAQAGYDFWADLHLLHCATPEIHRDDIHLEVEFMGASLAAPIIISAMTGGYPDAEKINGNLAYAAEKVGIGLGVGSQRAALKEPTLTRTYSVVATHSPPLVLANIGAPQLIPQGGGRGLTLEEVRSLMGMIGAQGLVAHLNFTQEVIQELGDVNAEGVLSAIGRLAREFPILAKETGGGISREVAEKLKLAGVRAVDVGGAGGTSFVAVEYHRALKAQDQERVRMARSLWEWGIPTPVAVMECRGVAGLPIVATGGIRSGIDAAKAIALGADLVGLAYPLLRPATESGEAVVEVLKGFIKELKTAIFLAGADGLISLRNTRMAITGRTREWLTSLGHDI